MDGFERRLGQSLQFKLSAWLAVVIVGVALAAAAFAFAAAFHEANELQDDQLRQIAAVVHRQGVPMNQWTAPIDSEDMEPESLVVLQLLNELGESGSPSNEATASTYIAFPADLKEGIQTVNVARQSWRVVVQTLMDGQRMVVGQRTSVRDEIARDSALRTLLPFFFLIPILLVLVGELIRTMFKPVKALAEELNQRPHDDLREISEFHVPAEIYPFVIAINRLLIRVTQSMAMQRRFLADAAHELRTPLTALSLQAERLGGVELSEPARERLGALQSGLKRSQQLLDQLLSLARVQDAPKKCLQPVSVNGVYLHVCADLMPLADAKGIDMGMVSEEDQKVLADEMDLRTLVKNLVDNAIRFTPDGGKVDLSVQQRDGHTVLCVEDSGPGIPEAERARVFNPFYRVLGHDEPGSGLGLSIVQTIAIRLGVRIHLEYADAVEKSGLRVEVVF